MDEFLNNNRAYLTVYAASTIRYIQIIIEGMLADITKIFIFWSSHHLHHLHTYNLLLFDRDEAINFFVIVI